jgi:nitroreductase
VEFSDVVYRRRMVRNYDPDRPVHAEVVDKLLGYAVHAPSAGFSQGWGFLVLEDAADRDRFWTTTTPPDTDVDSWLEGMRHAPVIVVAHSHRDAYLDRYAEPDKGWTDRDEARWPVPYWHIDTGFASLLVLLGAVDEGLGACFFGIPPERTADYREAFGVPDELTPIGAITLGYRAPDRRSPSLRRGRRGVDAVTHRGRWKSAESVP